MDETNLNHITQGNSITLGERGERGQGGRGGGVVVLVINN